VCAGPGWLRGGADWLDLDRVGRGLTAIERAELALDLLVGPADLAAAGRLARAHPGLRVVVDHLGKPPVRGGRSPEWAAGMARLGLEPNVTVKLSGLVTVADRERWTSADFAPYVDHVLELFTPRRMMLGSDWPVCLVGGSYDRVIGAYREVLGVLSADERDQVDSQTAIETYRLARSVAV
jgi:L-fuconolactonase